MPSGALPSETTVPAGGTVGAAAVAGSAAGVTARVAAGAGDRVSLLQPMTSRPITGKHSSAAREPITPLCPSLVGA
jgi:hypothetical protein